MEHTHNLRVVGVTRLSVLNVNFEAFQGDGVYLGTRLHPVANSTDPVAHNSNIIIARNAFDGINAENRNGVSVIDCSHCIIDSNSFSRLTLVNMPGAVDLEPNQQDEIVKDLAVTNNNINGSKSGAISVSLGFKDFLREPGHILIENNQVQNAKIGVSVFWSGQVTSGTPSLDILIWGNVVSSVDHALLLNGVSGVTVAHNYFSDSPMDIELGCSLGAANVRFGSNRFARIGSVPGQGVLLCGPLETITFEGNTFSDLGSPTESGSAVRFAGGSVVNINYTKNEFSSPNQVTRVVFGATSSVSFLPETNTWNGNLLHDGIQMGVFPHGAGSATSCLTQ
jgi:hypothetical protein